MKKKFIAFGAFIATAFMFTANSFAAVPDYTASTKLTPNYGIKYSKDGTFEKITSSSDIKLWVNGGIKSEKIDGKTVRTDYKTKELLIYKPSNVSGENDVNYDKETIKSLGKNAPKFKWLITRDTVLNPIEAHFSKTAQAEGRELASCSNGKLTAGKVTTETVGRVWVVDQNGNFGWAQFSTKIAPNVIYSTSQKLIYEGQNKDFDKSGKLTADGKKKLVSSLNINYGKSDNVYIDASYFYKPKTSKDYIPASLSALNYEITSDKTDIASVSALDNDGKFTITGQKEGIATVSVINTESQKKLSIKVSVKNPAVSVSFDSPRVTVTSTADGLASGNITVQSASGGSQTTDSIKVYPISRALTGEELSNAIINDNFYTSKLPSDVKISGFDYSVTLKSGNKVDIRVKKNSAISEYRLLIVSNTINDGSGYNGICQATGIVETNNAPVDAKNYIINFDSEKFVVKIGDAEISSGGTVSSVGGAKLTVTSKVAGETLKEVFYKIASNNFIKVTGSGSATITLPVTSVEKTVQLSPKYSYNVVINDQKYQNGRENSYKIYWKCGTNGAKTDLGALSTLLSNKKAVLGIDDRSTLTVAVAASDYKDEKVSYYVDGAEPATVINGSLNNGYMEFVVEFTKLTQDANILIEFESKPEETTTTTTA